MTLENILKIKSNEITTGNMIKQSSNKNTSKLPKILSIISFILTGVIVSISVYGYFAGWFDSLEDIQNAISGLGVFAPVVFILLQILQVTVPIIPNPVVSVAGVAMFGPYLGFLYNYIGACAGSMLAFYIAKIFGPKVLPKLFSQKVIDRYSNYTKKSKALIPLLTIAIALPVVPDDFLCYLAGTTHIKGRHFLYITLFGRAITISLFSIFFGYFYNQLVTII